MQEEMNAIKEIMESAYSNKIYELEFIEGKINDKAVFNCIFTKKG